MSARHVPVLLRLFPDRPAVAGGAAARFFLVLALGAAVAIAAAAVASRPARADGVAAVPSALQAPWVAAAYRHLGGNPTGWSRRWCAQFANQMLARAGYAGSGSALARSLARIGTPLSGPRIGAVAVVRGGRHVGFVVAGACPRGQVRLLSGNHGRRVGEGCYPAAGVVAYRWPSRRGA